MEWTQRFTMYDLLAIVFPGCFILWDIMAFINIDLYINELSYIAKHEILYYIAFFVTVYILGLAWNTIMGEIWRRFVKTISESCLKRELKTKHEEFFEHWNKLDGDTNSIRYKVAYAIVRASNTTSSINSIETQISMLRNLVMPFSFWICTILYQVNNDVCFCVIMGFLISLFVFSIAFVRQIRLYHIVLANYLMIKRAPNK